jgi:ABC-2 type transport system ATP-binding protein
MAIALEFDKVTKEYRGGLTRPTIRALDNFSLCVEQEEIFGFLGPNGAGKTTAIHLALGFMRATSGSGRLLGEPFGHAATRRRVGFLAEHVALYHRPAAKLVRFYGALNGMEQPRLNARVREVLDRLELEPVARRNVGKFSRGMLQRVGLAQALVNDPELLILDEPTSALDPAGRVLVREILLEAKAKGKTVFLSSHLLSEVEMICDRVAFLIGGRLARVGRTAELLESREQLQVSARGVDAQSFAGVMVADGLVRFTIPTEDQRRVIERVWSLGGEIISVNPVKRSLEQVFMELTRESERDECESTEGVTEEPKKA